MKIEVFFIFVLDETIFFIKFFITHNEYNEIPNIRIVFRKKVHEKLTSVIDESEKIKELMSSQLS